LAKKEGRKGGRVIELKVGEVKAKVKIFE